jgi:hypothetical protein
VETPNSPTRPPPHLCRSQAELLEQRRLAGLELADTVRAIKRGVLAEALDASDGLRRSWEGAVREGGALQAELDGARVELRAARATAAAAEANAEALRRESREVVALEVTCRKASACRLGGRKCL